MRVVATAGHVDHGKSTLIRALTGTDPDRWAIEKARGMTIDLGFAATTLASGEEIGFVDVPGHYRFVKKMLAGVASVDACIFVVDANEGWKPQSEEHLRILELLKIRSGVVALSKVAELDDELRQLATLDIVEHLEGTFLSEAEVVLVDSISGEGLDELRAALDRLVAATPAAGNRGKPRLWVDRAFAIKGSGTVVTGTLTGGDVSVDDELVLLPDHRRARVRSLQSHGHELATSAPGRRLALNISGVSHKDVVRGDVMVRSHEWHLTSKVDASLFVLPHLGRALATKGAYAAYIGTGDYPVRLRVLGSEGEIQPGATGMVRLWLKGRVPLPLVPGDRYVLRELGRDETVGGGEILDVDPVLPPRRASPSRSTQRIVHERGWLHVEDLERLAGERVPPTVGQLVIADDERSRLEASLRASTLASGSEGVDVATLSEVERALVVAGVEGLVLEKTRLFHESAKATQLSAAALQVLDDLNEHPWSPPTLDTSRRAPVRELETRDLVRRAGDLWFSSEAVDAAIVVLADLLQGDEGGFTVSQACQALGTSRKYGMPLLSYFDASGVTRRRGDRRIAGPVLARRISRTGETT